MIDVTAAIIEKEGRVLAARRKQDSHLAGYWEFPGGKLEPGESPEICLARELEEEFHIGAQIGSFVGESIYDYGTKIIRLLAYQVEHISGDFVLNDHDEVRWLAIDEMDSVKWAPADIPLVEQYRATASNRAYYNQNAQVYCEETRAFEVDELYKPFLSLLPPSAHILDLGCGSGRDSKAFTALGYAVTAVDGSPEIAACASTYLGQAVDVVTFQTLMYDDQFDGVWASASLLHCPRAQLPDALERVGRALKDGGVAYMSFKWGEGDRLDDRGRYFTNQTVDSLASLIESIPALSVIDLWMESRPLRGKAQRWVMALTRKAARA